MGGSERNGSNARRGGRRRGGERNRERERERERDRDRDRQRDGRGRNSNQPFTLFRKSGDHFRYEKPKEPGTPRYSWIPPAAITEPLPMPECPWCGRPIRELAQAITEKHSGAPLHFDCVLEAIAEREKLDRGDEVTYIGGGRFGILRFVRSKAKDEGLMASLRGNFRKARKEKEGRFQGKAGKPPAAEEEEEEVRKFSIKKILEWENPDKREDWRLQVRDRYSRT